jgi:hypothetical protein
MKKQLDIGSIQNELQGGSAFFPSYKKHDSPASPVQQTPVLPKEPEKEADTSTPSTTSTPVPPVRVVRDVLPIPPVLPKKRIMKQRHPFDIWQDQYEALQELALEERKLGGIGSMSAMAREGLDLIIAKKRKDLKK